MIMMRNIQDKEDKVLLNKYTLNQILLEMNLITN